MISNSTAVTQTAVFATIRPIRREYRHHSGQCGRLLFVGYLPAGTHIEIRCPACGRLHVIDVETPQIDIGDNID